MAEASWGDDALTPDIDWSMSAALANVPRGGEELPEVASLRAVVRAWLDLDPAHQAAATLTPERPLTLGGVTMETLHGEAIAALAERLPG